MQPYVDDSCDLARQTLRPFDWDSERMQRLLDAITYHHALRPQWRRGPEVELLRRADLVDAAPVLFRFGIQRAWLRSLFEEFPRDGLYRGLARLLLGMLRSRPRTLLTVLRSDREPARP